MKQNFLIFSLFFSMSLFAQIEVYDTYHFDSEVEDSVTNSSRAIYKSSNGNSFPTKGVFRGLTIFVCIIYDQNDTIYKHIKHGNGSQYWQKDITNSINSPIYRPTYMKSLFDVDAPNLLKPKYNGVVTRLYAESSFDELILLSDFMVVNILQSQITPNNPGADFDRYALMDSVISYINQNGGLNTIYGHNSISDYDNMTRGSKGLEKPLVPDGRIDFINFLTMNTINNKSKYTINGVNYGDVNWGSGNSGLSPSVKLKMGNSYCDGYNTGTYQCIGHEDITHHKKSILTHEFAHYFLGGNETHTSGGGHNDGGTFLGTQRGYGLYEGGLLTCNAYERWRLGWQSVSNNNYPIAANGINSDIVAQFSGEQTFTLRDFVTYGDAIRIKLPYKDNTTSLNQYICLENHQVGKNSKLDGFKYSEAATCRDVNQAGIYAYYQVGKDILESASSSSDIYPSRESDHLKIISAEGNYNVVYHSNGQDCIGWAGDIGRPRFTYHNQNVFLGVNNQTSVLSYNTQNSTLRYPNDYQDMGAKYKDGVLYNYLPYKGDNFDAFVPNPEISMDISTNPAAVNTLTFYTYISGNSISQWAPYVNRTTRKIYLTGLSIKMIDPNPSSTAIKAYTVKVRWDDYDVKQNINWAGDIVLKEQLNLLADKVITLEQNLTPSQIDKDPVSNFFAPPTKFTCENNSQMKLFQNSQMILKDKSSLILNGGSSLSIQDNARIVVKSGSTLILKPNSSLQIIGRGRITIESGAYLCVENGANINLQDVLSAILLRDGAILSANPALFNNTNCISNIANIQKTGNGAIYLQNTDVYIQNETISSSRFVAGKNIFAGNNVTNTKPNGDVIINNNATVILDADNEVYIEAGVDVQLGAELEIR